MTATLVGRLSLDGAASPGGADRWPAGPNAGARYAGVGVPPGVRTFDSDPFAVRTGGSATVDKADGVVVVLLGGLAGTGDSQAIRSGVGLAAQWARHGERCLARVAGEWLAVVWDPRTATLTCARSARGYLRLFWCADGRGLRFATGLGELLPPGPGNRCIDEGFLAEMLVNSLTSYTATPFVGVSRLPDGHLLEAGPTRAPRVRPWPGAAFTPLAVSPAEAVPELRRRLETVVADHVVADGAGAGVFVSGGIDSNAVLAVARQATRSVVGCSWVFPGQPHDESTWLDDLDRRSPDPVWRFLPRDYEWDSWRQWAASSLEPPLRPNIAMSDALLPLLCTAGVSRMLTGEGGDDWFGGGPLHWPALVRRGRLPTLLAQARRDCPRQRTVAGRLWNSGLKPLVPQLRRPVAPPWIGAEFARRVQLSERLWTLAQAQRHAAVDPVRARVARVSLPLHVWQFEGIRSRFAARGVDWCHPLHDRRIVELVLGLPGEAVWRATETKSLLRASVADLVPAQILRRQSKSSFEAPILAAVRAVGGVEALVGHRVVTEGYVDLPALRQQQRRMEACLAAGRSARTYGRTLATLWNALSTALWMTEVNPS